MATRVCSYSKINLGLAIGPVRADGFHSLATLYQTLALHDLVTVEARSASQNRAPVNPISQRRDMGHPGSCECRITLTTNHPQVPADASNTAWKMVERALARMNVAAEVDIHIEKNLPVQGGLGAGSANAAAALIGLERELGVALPEAERLEIAAEVGSDVPLFLLGGAVMGTGRGEIVSAMSDLPATPCVIAVPEMRVSTPKAFRDWDALCETKAATTVDPTSQDRDAHPNEQARRGPRDVGHPGLTSPVQPGRLEELSRVYASVLGVSPAAEQTHGPSGIVRGSDESDTQNGLAENTLLALVRTGIENDFESVVFPQYPFLREIKRLLTGTPAGVSSGTTEDWSGNALVAALSVSGSALFGLYRTEADARTAQQRVQATGCKAILTETLPRQEYWRRMFAE